MYSSDNETPYTVFDSVTRVWEVRSSFKGRGTEFNITFGETERETFNPDSLYLLFNT